MTYRKVVGRLITEKLEMEAMRLHPKLTGLYLNPHTFATNFNQKLGYVVHYEGMIKKLVSHRCHARKH